jgi:hypothetical protein
MPHETREQAEINPSPYTQTLNLLRKIDLLRLSLELRLSTEGSVVVLRNRLRAYLNTHRETLTQNPRYVRLYPAQQRPVQLRAPDVQPQVHHANHNRPPTPPSPALSHSSQSSNSSYDSWHGIQQPEPQPPAHPVHAELPQYAYPQEPVVHYQPPLSPVPSFLLQVSPPPMAYAGGGRE